MSGFHEILFPLEVALGASGGPERVTEVVTTATGVASETRNSIRSAGEFGSIGRYPAPASSTASNATIRSSERGIATATRSSGPAPTSMR